MRRRQRSGFTMIELVAAIASATVLTLALASTVLLSSRLLESTAGTEEDWHDKEISQRIAADLRFAKTVSDNSGNGFSFTRPSGVAGADETINYESYYDGLTRQLAGQPAAQLDPEAPGYAFEVDGVTAATHTTSDTQVRVRASSVGASSFITDVVTLPVPYGCKSGDLLVLVVHAMSPQYLGVGGGWNYLQGISMGTSSSILYYRYWDASMDPTISVYSWPTASMSVAVVAIENANTSWPFLDYQTDWNFATPSVSSSHPAPLVSSEIWDNELNLQFTVAQGSPWPVGTLGLAGFSDVNQTTAAVGTAQECSVGVTVRNGPIPTMTTTPRVLHQTSGVWGQFGLRLGANP